MHPTLHSIQNKLTQIVTQLQSAVPSDEPLGTAHGNWSFPGLTKNELIEEAQLLISLIADNDTDDISKNEVQVADYERRLEHLRAHTIPQIWGNSAQAVPAYIFTLNGLRRALIKALPTDDPAEVAAKFRKIQTQLRGLEARLNGLDPRTSTLTAMVERIEHAYTAADQLPADLEALDEARKSINQKLSDSTAAKNQIETLKGNAVELEKQLSKHAEDAKSVLEQCETAYSAATSVGLAAAFDEKSKSLSESMWLWVVGLLAALLAGNHFGSAQLHTLNELSAQPNVSTGVLVLNLLLSLLSIAAPIWFGWLATKQIGQRFRLAEDYAYKASISRAYEGFRREASRIDKDLEAKLLESALSRLDELPLRYVETDNHGSPWHEFASSSLVKQALRVAPDFAEQVKELAAKAVTSKEPPKP
jgi:hypothetical protein